MILLKTLAQLTSARGHSVLFVAGLGGQITGAVSMSLFDTHVGNAARPYTASTLAAHRDREIPLVLLRATQAAPNGARSRTPITDTLPPASADSSSLSPTIERPGALDDGDRYPACSEPLAAMFLLCGHGTPRGTKMKSPLAAGKPGFAALSKRITGVPVPRNNRIGNAAHYPPTPPQGQVST
jgi:hypothetical protein